MRLQPYSYDHVRVLISPKYELSGNQREVEDLNRKCWDYNGTYVWLKRMYCGGQASYCCENLTFIRLDTSGHSWIRRPYNGTVVDAKLLLSEGIIRKELDGVKVLGNGTLTKKLTVVATKFSKTAEEKIQAVGGKTEVK